MPQQDLREFLTALEGIGEFHRHEATIAADLEIGAIVQRIAEKGGPAVEFTRVAGAPEGTSFVGASLNRGSRTIWAKVACALGLDPSIAYTPLLDEIVKRMEAPVKPMQVRTGPCKENLLHGEQIDLTRMGFPRIHGADSAACVSSWAATIVQEPGSKYVAWELIPHLVAGPRQLAARLASGSVVGGILERYRAAGEDMPFAIALGGSPVVAFTAAFRRGRRARPAPDLASGLQRAPLQLVKCECSELLVPATTEMVIEGVVRTKQSVPSGVFPSSFGFTSESGRPSHLWEVTSISFRSKPVLPFASWGVPITEAQLAHTLDADSQLKQEFIRRGTPVRDVYTPPWLAGMATAVSTKTPYTAFSQAVAGIVRTTPGSQDVPYIFVCDDDIDVTNPVTLFHALVTKCRPGRDTWQILSTRAADDAPYLDAAERASGAGPAVIFDCTWPLDWDRSIAVPPRVSFDQCYPREIQEKVLAAWSGDYGFPLESTKPVVRA